MTTNPSASLFTQKPTSVKYNIMQKLSQKWPLTAKQLHYTMGREYGVSATYQAVHKALLEMEKEKILEKKDNKWKIRHEWLDQQEKFIQNTKHKYAGRKNRYDIDLNYEGPQEFEFDSFTELSLESAKLIANNILCQKKETAYWILDYGWWPLKFSFNHIEILKILMERSPKSCHLIKKNTPFDYWIQRQYNKVRGYGACNVEMPFNDDMLIQGDWIVQINFSKKDKQLIKRYWTKWKNLNDCFLTFGLKKEPKMKIKVTVLRNKEMAKILKIEWKRYFENSKKISINTKNI